jgi:2-dehydro-3-deoxyphosphogluconate aldolase/(4S)-4-hydroxy-2-oxoglutarate aldolase
VRALKAALPQVELIPTGGVSLSTAAEFLSAGAFALGVGGDLVNESAILAGTPELITEKAKQYVSIIQARHNGAIQN